MERRIPCCRSDWRLGRALGWNAPLLYAPSAYGSAPATRGGPASRSSGSSTDSTRHRAPGTPDRTPGSPIESAETRKGLAYESGTAHNWHFPGPLAICHITTATTDWGSPKAPIRTPRISAPAAHYYREPVHQKRGSAVHSPKDHPPTAPARCSPATLVPALCLFVPVAASANVPAESPAQKLKDAAAARSLPSQDAETVSIPKPAPALQRTKPMPSSTPALHAASKARLRATGSTHKRKLPRTETKWEG